NYAKEVHSAVEKIIDVHPDLVISTGDMVAGQKAGLDYLAMWNSFHHIVTNPLKEQGILFAVTHGNHDGSGYFVYQYEREIFKAQWPAKDQLLPFIDSEFFPLRYSFAIKDILFISLDATKVGKLNKDQISWVRRQLANGIEYQ